MTTTNIDADLEASHHDFSASHLPWRLRVPDVATARTATVDLGEAWFVDCSVGPMVGQRADREIRATAKDYVGVLLVRRGTEVFTQHDAEAVVGPGSAVLWDSVRPSGCFTASTLVKHTLFLPRESFDHTLSHGRSAGIRALPASAGLRLLGSWLAVARSHADDPTASTMAGALAIDLVHAALSEARGDSSASKEVLLLRVKSHLSSNLHDPELTLDDAARSCAISLRYLHALFSGTGETAAEFLRRKRLERAASLLRSGPESITQAALACGFANHSAFSRAFRAHHGTSPSEYREIHRVRP